MEKLLKFIKQDFPFWGIAFLLFFIPIYPKFPLFAVKGTYVSIRLEDIFVAGIVITYFFCLLCKRDFSILKDNLTKLFGLYFAAGFISVLSGYFITKNIVLHIALLHFLRRIEYISLFFIAYSSFRKTAQLKTFGKIILVSTMAVVVYGLGQKFFGWPVVSTMNKEFSKGLMLKLTWWARINSTFAGHYDLAAYMVMILALSASVMMIAKKIKEKIAVGLIGLFSYYLLILTASRISFVAYIVGVLVVLIFSKRGWWVIPFLTFSILGMIFSDDLGQRYAATFKIDLSFMSGMVRIKPEGIALIPGNEGVEPTVAPAKTTPGKPTTPRPLEPTFTPTPTPTPTVVPVATSSGEYFEPTQLAVNRSTDIRLKVEWPRAVRAFLKNPLLGTGYSSITLATDNDYLRMLGETGILGMLGFLGVLGELFRRFYFFLREKNNGKTEKLIVLGILGAAVGYFLNAIFIDVFEASKVAFFFWIMMGVGLRVIDLNLKADGKSKCSIV